MLTDSVYRKRSRISKDDDVEMTQEGEDSDPYDFTEEENSKSTLLETDAGSCLFVLLNVKAVQPS